MPTRDDLNRLRTPAYRSSIAGSREPADSSHLPAAPATTPRPLDLGLELTNLCNLHCTHCIRGSHQSTIDRLELPFIRRVLDQAAELFSPVEVVFTGGEPLAAEIFAQVVGELKVRRLAYRFVTNGWLVPRHLPTILGHPPRYVRVSLSGGTERTHDLERGHGSFRRALIGAAVLLSRGIPTDMSLVLTRQSRGELAQTVELANALGLRELHFIFMQPTPETALSGSDLAPHEWRALLPEIAALAQRSSVPVLVDYGAYMPLPRRTCNTLALRQLYVDARGRVPFCCQLSRYGSGGERILGDLLRESLATVIARAEEAYSTFVAETETLHQIGRWDELDDFPCLGCARRHGQTRFLGDFPEHPWAGLARPA